MILKKFIIFRAIVVIRLLVRPLVQGGDHVAQHGHSKKSSHTRAITKPAIWS
jgi:hypothetical protein